MIFITNKQMNCRRKHSKQTRILSHFQTALPSSTPIDSNLEILSNDTLTNNRMTKTTAVANNVDVCPLPSTSMNSCSERNKKNESLTQEEMDELLEEPLNIENALKAVMGYTPQDDKRICRFYDPKTKACFKGAHCKLEHTTILKGKAPHIIAFTVFTAH